MVNDLDRMNRYGAKFFIGQMVRVAENTHSSPRDAGKVGIVHAISTSTRCDTGKRSYEYALDPSDTYIGAWYDENELDFVDHNEREEWEKHGKGHRNYGQTLQENAHRGDRRAHAV